MSMHEAARCTLRTNIDAMACPTRAALIARHAGFPEKAVHELQIVVSELATNIIRHGDAGTILLRHIEEPEAGLEVVAIDEGPGIDCAHHAVRDGVSKGRVLVDEVAPPHRESLGTGLGAVARLMDRFDIDNLPEGGAYITAFKALRTARQ